MDQKKNKTKWVAVSGGFDPIHIGHARMIKEARKHGDKVVVILNNDNWLMTKKGFVFMPQEERRELLMALGADKVIVSVHGKDDSDRSVCRELSIIRPDVFCNGGDRVKGNVPEADVCKQLGIKMIYNVGHGGKVQSSSWLTGALLKEYAIETRPWGTFQILRAAKGFWVKVITVHAGKRTSLQKHDHRRERWILIDGDITGEIGGRKISLQYGDGNVDVGVIHRLSSQKGGTIIEVATGDDVREDDITRYEDDHGRV